MQTKTETTLQQRVQALVENGRLTSEDGAELLRHAAAPAARANRAEPQHGDDGALAIIGIGLNVPGAHDLDELAEILHHGRTLIEPMPDERVELALSAAPGLAAHLPESADERRRDPRGHGSWLRDIERFDPRPFGLDDAEAVFLGPAERLFLQVADEALVSAGQRRERLRGSATGVFAAYTPYPMFEYLKLFSDMDERAFVANIPATLPYHLAYRLDLRGPVLAVNTTCSSSLAALHLAKNALRAGDCDLAVVAGVNVRIFPFDDDIPDHIVRSANLRCSPFSASADGIVDGEGVVALVVKRLADALRDRDMIHAVIAGSAMGSDGASNGLQAPNPEAQVEIIRAALADAGTTAADIGYVEAHGAGTRLGDFVEIDALSTAFRADAVPVGGCPLGSAKANFGHLGDCAGLIGLLAALTCLRTGTIHRVAGLEKLSPLIPWHEAPVAPSVETVAWPRRADGVPRQAGVSSLGISGTNVHVILREPPAPPEGTEDTSERITPVLVSARSRRALLGYLHALHRGLAAAAPMPLADITRTLTACRDHGPSRAALLVRDHAELVAALERTSRLRTFERAPGVFAEQGIYLADEPTSRQTAVAAVDRYQGPPLAQGDAELVRAFLSGAELGDTLRARFAAGHCRDLPVEPPVTQAIWPRATASDAPVDELFYDLVWRPAARQAPDTPVGTGRWLLVGDPDDEVVAAITARLAARGERVVGVAAGSAFARVGADRYTLDPAEPRGWEQLLRDLGDDALSDLTAVVYAVGLTEQEPAATLLPEIEERLTAHSYGVFGLARAIAAAGITTPLRAAVVTRVAERVGPGDTRVADATRLAGFGVVKVLSQEIPTIRQVVVDHDLTGDAATVAAELIGEIDAAASEPDEHVAFRDGRRYVKRVVRQPRAGGDRLPIRTGGTYVIAGGTGYLGPQVATFLAERGAGTVALLSRTGLPDREQWDDLAASEDPSTASRFSTLIALEHTGTRVISVPCDVTDHAAVARVAAEIRAAHGPIAGCFMLTKQLYQRWIHELRPEEYVGALRNRVHGLWNLTSELGGAELDFMVVFSSISSLIGTKGASECCAVNQYLDAIGAQLSARGVPTHVMNWTLILDDISEFAGDSPIPPIDFAQFHGAMRRFFDDGGGFGVIAAIDPHEALRLRPVLKLRFDESLWEEMAAAVAVATSTHDAGSSSAGEERAAEPERQLSEAEIRQAVRAAWADALGPVMFTETASFFSVGGTSLSALRLVQLLRRAVPAVGFEVGDLYNNPTIAAQVAFLGGAGHEASDTAARAHDVPASLDLDELLDAVTSGAVSPEDALLDWSTGEGD